jgi:hypothetical protein
MDLEELENKLREAEQCGLVSIMSLLSILKSDDVVNSMHYDNYSVILKEVTMAHTELMDVFQKIRACVKKIT